MMLKMCYIKDFRSVVLYHMHITMDSCLHICSPVVNLKLYLLESNHVCIKFIIVTLLGDIIQSILGLY